MLRKAGLVLVSLTFAGLVAFVLVLLEGRPADTGVPEIGIGQWASEDGIVYISGRRLACEPLSTDSRFTTACTILIYDNLLTVMARPSGTHPDRFEGACEAEYRGQVYPCQPGLHRGTVRTSALIEEPLGLSGIELEALRDRYWVENAHFYFPLISFLTAILTVTAIFAWTQPLPGRGKRRLAGLGAAASLAFIFSFILLFEVTRYLWN